MYSQTSDFVDNVASSIDPRKLNTIPNRKALPTIRDHTTDQLGPEGDEYIPRETDDNGEKKVTATGQLLNGRDYRMRTFWVPNRGDKLFMLATECARVLGYRDSYLLFNKNRTLYKIIATQAEKEYLIHQEILPFSYRSRQIAIVTARSMFRQFGSRVVANGQRVRDDYWEDKARKQGFTEEDLAGERRPGAARARDAAAAEAASTSNMLTPDTSSSSMDNRPWGTNHVLLPSDLIQRDYSSYLDRPETSSPTVLSSSRVTQGSRWPDMRQRDFSNIQRPRQEITGPADQNRIQNNPPQELLTRTHHSAEYNKSVNLQRNRSSEYLDQCPSKAAHLKVFRARLPTGQTGQTGLEPVAGWIFQQNRHRR
ncbi:hypothetical protein DL98DRAFT_435923 [Cadophora sp. DSE1049]|nr:hypothetical protein DL98DRAFT_435923 [Cadophora sp. DSE1049]